MGEVIIPSPRRSAKDVATTIDQSVESGTFVEAMEFIIGDVENPKYYHSYGFARAMSRSLESISEQSRSMCNECSQRCVSTEVEIIAVPSVPDRSESIHVKHFCPSSGEELLTATLIVQKEGH